MSETANLPARGGARRRVPVTDPVRVLLLDPDAAAASALSRAIDMDRELAVVGVCRDPKRARLDADHCRPDLIAIRLKLDDPRCLSALTALVEANDKPCVVVLGEASDLAADRAREAARHKNKIRAVAEENFGIAAEPATLTRVTTGAWVH